MNRVCDRSMPLAEGVSMLEFSFLCLIRELLMKSLEESGLHKI